jgi:hypothetical protein
MEILACPEIPEAGVIDIVRFAPLPPSTIPLGATNAAFEDIAVTVKLAEAVCASPIVKGIEPVEAPELTIRFKTSVIVGAELVPPVIVKFVFETSK